MKSMFNNVKKQVNKDIYNENHGKSSEGAFNSGIRVFAPLDNDHKKLPIGTNYEIPGAGTITLYDGKVRIVDSETFNHELKQFTKRREQIENIGDAFLKSGDSMAIKYLGYYYNWLPEGKPDKESDVIHLLKCLMADGYSDDQAKKIIDNDICPYDGRPNSITVDVQTSERYIRKLNKLLWVIRYVGIVFTGKEVAPTPESQILSGEELTNPNTEATQKAKDEVKNARNYNNNFILT